MLQTKQDKNISLQANNPALSAVPDACSRFIIKCHYVLSALSDSSLFVMERRLLSLFGAVDDLICCVRIHVGVRATEPSVCLWDELCLQQSRGHRFNSNLCQRPTSSEETNFLDFSRQLETTLNIDRGLRDKRWDAVNPVVSRIYFGRSYFWPCLPAVCAFGVESFSSE